MVGGIALALNLSESCYRPHHMCFQARHWILCVVKRARSASMDRGFAPDSVTFDTPYEMAHWLSPQSIKIDEPEK